MAKVSVHPRERAGSDRYQGALGIQDVMTGGVIAVHAAAFSSSSLEIRVWSRRGPARGVRECGVGWLGGGMYSVASDGQQGKRSGARIDLRLRPHQRRRDKSRTSLAW